MNSAKQALAVLTLGGGLGLVAPHVQAAAAGPDPADKGATERATERTGPADNAGNQPARPERMQHAAAPLLSVLATVEDVDSSKREVQLKDSRGQAVTVQVPADVQGFDQLKKGDRVDVSYYQSVAMALQPPNPAAPMAAIRDVNVGGATVAHEINATLPVTSVDAKNNVVTFKAPDGATVTAKVNDPQLQQRLKALKPGETLQLAYTEAVATNIEPHAKR
jgi:hypothetical protein